MNKGDLAAPKRALMWQAEPVTAQVGVGLADFGDLVAAAGPAAAGPAAAGLAAAGLAAIPLPLWSQCTVDNLLSAGSNDVREL